MENVFKFPPSPESEYLSKVAAVLSAAAATAYYYKQGHVFGLNELVKAVEALHAEDEKKEGQG